jgi:hypothetical protein
MLVKSKQTQSEQLVEAHKLLTNRHIIINVMAFAGSGIQSEAAQSLWRSYMEYLNKYDK